MPANFPPFARPLRKKWYKVHLYTLIQIALLALAWGVNLSPAGLLFSVIIVAIVPFNKFVMPLIFTKEEIAILDSEQGDEAESNPHIESLRATLDMMIPSKLQQGAGGEDGGAVQAGQDNGPTTTTEVMDNNDLPKWLHSHLEMSVDEQAELVRARELIFERAKIYVELRDLNDQTWCAPKQD
jgi:hypothetical protein